MTVVPIVLMGAVVYTFLNFLKNLSGRNWNGVITQLVAWVAGIVAVLLFAHSDFAQGIAIGYRSLASLDGFGQLIIGLQASSLLGLLHDFKQAVDSSDTSKEPPLVPPPSTPAA